MFVSTLGVFEVQDWTSVNMLYWKTLDQVSKMNILFLIYLLVTDLYITMPRVLGVVGWQQEEKRHKIQYLLSISKINKNDRHKAVKNNIKESNSTNRI